LKEKVGLHDSSQSTQVFYTNTDPKVLSDILGSGYSVIKLDF
jgi:hypothetical protein